MSNPLKVSSPTKNDRFVILKILTWLQMVILSLMAAIGSVYLGALLGGFSELSSLSFPFAYSLAAVLQILFYFFFGYAILLAIYRRLTVPKTPLDPGLGERLGRLAAETQTRMRGKSPVKPLILRKSSNAFNRGKNRIVGPHSSNLISRAIFREGRGSVVDLRCTV